MFCIICSCKSETHKLPILGNYELQGKDTIYPTIKEFSFVDQDSSVITNDTFKNQIYVADFIFLSCPTICPIMNNQLKSVYTVYKDNPKVSFLSHTIDPKHDTIPALKEYTVRNDIGDSWHFVTGNRDSIMKIAGDSYFTIAYPDANEPGGLVHSGGFVLVDKNSHVRGVYDGTDETETQHLIDDIEILLAEQFSN